jgi:hypothetical protein
MGNHKFEKVFGMKATPIQEAIRHTLNWYRNQLALKEGNVKMRLSEPWM